MSNIDKEALRATHLSESEALKQKQRHGFFSVPISTAIGDDGPYKTKLHPRNETGKPETQPRKFQTSPPKEGKLQNTFFGPLNSLSTTGKVDEFVEQPRRFYKDDHQNRKLSKHQKQFYPGSSYIRLHKPSYLYKQQANPQKQPRRNRQPDGKVKSKARQFQTNIQTRVIADLFKPIKNISDPIERAHDIEWQRLQQQRAKQHEQVFSPNKFTADLFHSNRQVLNDHEIKRQKYFHQTKFRISNHEQKWRDNNANRKGLYGFLAPFPPYMEDPLRFPQRQDKSGSKEREIFRSMSRTTRSIPSPSVLQNPSNLRRSFNHSFSHRPG